MSHNLTSSMDSSSKCTPRTGRGVGIMASCGPCDSQVLEWVHGTGARWYPQWDLDVCHTMPSLHNHKSTIHKSETLRTPSFHTATRRYCDISLLCCTKGRQHPDFPGGHPPEYYPSLRLLNFAKQTGYGVHQPKMAVYNNTC